MSRLRIAAQRLAFVGTLLLLWEAATGGFGLPPVLDPIIVARPSRAFAEIGAYAASGLLAKDLTATLQASSIGLALGIIGGVSFGLLLGYAKAVADTVEPVLVAFNSLPRIALAPVLIIAFGLGIASKIFLAFFTVFFVIFFNTYLGIRSVDPELVKAVRVMGGTRADLARYVILPSVFSWIFAALRTSVSFALSGAVVGEFVGSTAGLGYRMVISAGLLDTNRTYAILLLLMAIAVTLVELAKCVEDRVLRWRPTAAVMS
ncbi:MAG TPA: ABC transporter permease [Candidatus Limnocylindria bacterium]|nr:ABC transporter permease [Candidatus Limnocylindria bacterium]